MFCIVSVFYETNSISVSSSREDLPYFPAIRYSVEVLLTTELLVFFKHFWSNIRKDCRAIYRKSRFLSYLNFLKFKNFFLLSSLNAFFNSIVTL